MTQCAVCGQQLGQSDVFCPACGSPVGAAAMVTAPPPAQQQASNNTMIIAIVAGIGVLAIALLFFGSSMGTGGGGRGLFVAGSATSTVAATQTATPTPPPVVTPPVTPPPPAPAPAKPSPAAPDTSEDGRFATLVPAAAYTGGGAQNIDFDYVQFYEGAAAEKEAAKRGDTADSGYYIVNDNTKIRTYELQSGTKILIHAPSDPMHTHSFTYDEFRNLLNGDSYTYGGFDYTLHNDLYWVTIKNHKVVKLENVWFP